MILIFNKPQIGFDRPYPIRSARTRALRWVWSEEQLSRGKPQQDYSIRKAEKQGFFQQLFRFLLSLYTMSFRQVSRAQGLLVPFGRVDETSALLIAWRHRMIVEAPHPCRTQSDFY